MKTKRIMKKLIPLVALFLLSSCGNSKPIAPGKKIEVESVSFRKLEEFVEVSRTLKMEATISPISATDKSLTWTSSDKNVATISNNGVIKAISSGQTIIRAQSKTNASKVATCYINVVDEIVHPESLQIEQSSVTIERGASLELTANISPENVTNDKLTWTVSNENVSVDKNGRITGKSVGNAVVSATTEDGEISSSVNVSVTESTIDQWTVLIYMCGANLESDYANKEEIYDPYTGRTYEHDGIGLAVSDIMEILAVPNKPNDINIVIETGGANEWTKTQYANYGNYNISSKYLQRHHVENNKIVQDGNNLTYANMGLANTLKDFVKYGLTTYPAHKTALILWNHGGGLQGACFDEKKNSDGLEPKELIQGVSSALNDIGRTEKLEVIGYDCCLMQVQELANINAQYFNYMVASQESESGTGWDYDTWIDDLYAYKDTGDILKSIAQGFIKDNGGVSSRYNDQTLSYLNLRYVEDYRQAWEALAGELKNKLNEDNANSFNKFVDGVKKYAGDSYYSYGLFDSKNFLQKLETSTSFRTSTSSIIAAYKAHRKLVEYSICGLGAGKSYGLSMFWSAYLIPGWWSNSSTYQYNDYSDYYGFSNWDYLNSHYGSTIEVSMGGYFGSLKSRVV